MGESKSSREWAFDSLTRIVTVGVRSGFRSWDDLIAEGVEAARDECPELSDELLQSEARRILSETVGAIRTEQASWPVPTDYDRLERAFAKLEASGIVCRHDFSCCGTCAAGEIWDEIEQEQASGRTIRGAAHYNMQDLEGALEGERLHFSYASVAEGDEALRAIGHEIVDAMRREGLDAEWNGNTNRRMSIAIDWKRRLPA